MKLEPNGFVGYLKQLRRCWSYCILWGRLLITLISIKHMLTFYNQGRTGQYVIYQENLEGGAASWGHRMLGALQLKI